MEDFAERLKENCNLKRLKLSHCGLNNLSISSICQILAENPNLLELDISWNNILPNSMKELMDELEINRTLRYLNLSWNQIKGMNASLNKDIITKFSNFITLNTSLIHLDLCSINLQGDDLKKIGKLISMSSSLLGFHLCGNPMTHKQIKYLRKCLRIEDEEPTDASTPNIVDIDAYGNMNSDDESGIKRQNTSLKVSSLINGIKTKFVKRDIKLKEQSRYSSSNFINKFIVTRILGHPELAKDADRWREVQECWI